MDSSIIYKILPANKSDTLTLWHNLTKTDVFKFKHQFSVCHANLAVSQLIVLLISMNVFCKWLKFLLLKSPVCSQYPHPTSRTSVGGQRGKIIDYLLTPSFNHD